MLLGNITHTGVFCFAGDGQSIGLLERLKNFTDHQININLTKLNMYVFNLLSLIGCNFMSMPICFERAPAECLVGICRII